MTPKFARGGRIDSDVTRDDPGFLSGYPRVLCTYRLPESVRDRFGVHEGLLAQMNEATQ